MPDLDEQNGMHSDEIKWADYKLLVANREIEENKIYFIEDLTNQEEVLQDLLTTMNQLKNLIENLS